MAYYTDRDMDRQQYEDWHRYGRERGFFDRASDEVKSWFGDEDAEHRRQMDQRMDHIRGQQERYGQGRYGQQRYNQQQSGTNRGGSSRPEWQRRDYSGPSPRGSRMDEQGRYDDPSWGSRRGGRQTGGWRRNEEFGGQEYGRGGWGGEREYYGEERQPRFFDRGSRRERGYESEWGRNAGQYPSDYQSANAWGQRDYENRWGGDPYGQAGEERGMFGGHRGRGPRNYRRSDERISDEINEFLTLHPELDASDVDIIVDDGIVTLRGQVESRNAKRLAEEISEDVYGVKEVHNELRIDRDRGHTNNQDQFGRQNVLSR